jgi:iron complex transport system substrate-binding protein
MWMAKIFHPEKFRHIDMNKELKYFYSEFFRYKLSDEEARRILLNLPPD